MDLEIEGRGAFVVGATGDIGRATVRRLLAEGARVVAGARSAGRMSEKLGAAGLDVHGMVEIDLRDEASTEAAAERARDLLGGAVDILICAAGGDVTYAPVWQIPPDVYERDYRIKLVGTAQLCTGVAARMAERGSGAIVNVIGIATDIVVTVNPAGSAANSGLRSFTRVLAKEVAGSGVRVVGVSPGFVEGERLARFATDEQARRLKESIPLRALADPEELADVIVFVASPRASYITGEIVIVDGGATLR
ncbi:MAG: SDR family oxidoreductase [Rhodospirillaceae bacterium]|nr:SDR family oxidoreductase [Rhodospirillaceae bacterium]